MSKLTNQRGRRLLTRRLFLGGASALMGAGALGFPKLAHGAARGVDRKFIWFFASGGWDTSTVLDPHFNTDGVDMDIDTELGAVGNLRFTNGPDREPVDRFFRRWGGHAAIVNGVNHHSVGHDSARQLVMTGTSASSYADWPTIIASNSPVELPLPHVVFSGPSYPGTSGASVVRAGGGTLLDLIDGSIVGYSDSPAPLPATPADSMVDSFVHKRISDFAAGQTGLARKRAEGLLSNIERAMELEGRRFEAGLSDLGNTMLDQAIKASEMMRLGLTRTAMIAIPGGWDSHGGNQVQAPQQTDFYDMLDQLMDHLATTPGQTTTWLIDEVVIVAQSDFGRTPRLNGGGGKDHWPYGSALVAGAGVQGNRVFGKTDESLIAVDSINLATGLEQVGHDQLGSEHLGTAFLKLAGLDPENFLPGVPSLDALIRGTA